jgi:hypothetical protein
MKQEDIEAVRAVRRDSDAVLGSTLLAGQLPRKVKCHFLESELATANDLIREYIDHLCGEQIEGYPEMDSNFRHKLIWLLERLQEEVL